MRHTEILQLIQEEPRPEAWDGEVSAHVAECERCRATAEAARLMGERLRETSLAATAPERLRARLMASVEEARPAPRRAVRRPAWWNAVIPAALAAGVVLGIGLSRIPSLLPGGEPGGEVPRDVAAYLDDVTHDLYLLDRTNRPLELRTHDGVEAEAWLSHGLGFDVDLAAPPAGFRLQGARVWHTLSRLSALAYYTDPAQRRVVVFAVPAADLSFEGARRVDDLWVGEGWGNHGVVWRRGELAWAAVSDMEPDDLLDWVRAWRSP